MIDSMVPLLLNYSRGKIRPVTIFFLMFRVWLLILPNVSMYHVFFVVFCIRPSPGLLPVLGPLERYRLLHLTRPCLVALGRVLIWVEGRILGLNLNPLKQSHASYEVSALPPSHHTWVPCFI